MSKQLVDTYNTFQGIPWKLERSLNIKLHVKILKRKVWYVPCHKADKIRFFPSTHIYSQDENGGNIL